MRLALLVVLLAFPSSALAKDQASCVAKCTDKLSQCSKACKDEKCLSRCADRIQTCQTACSNERPAKAPKGEDGNGNEKDPAPPEKGNFPSVKPPH